MALGEPPNDRITFPVSVLALTGTGTRNVAFPIPDQGACGRELATAFAGPASFRAAESAVMDIKAIHARFTRRIAGCNLTPELAAQAERVKLTLRSLEFPDATQSKAFMQASKDDIDKFARMWAGR